MPLYEYECANCHHRFEKIEPYSAPEKQKCPKCGKVARRVLTAPAIQFKGSGWYATDYAGKKSGSEAKSGGTPTPPSETSPAKPSAEKTSTDKSA